MKSLSEYSLLSALNIGRDLVNAETTEYAEFAEKTPQLFRPLFLKPHNDARLVLPDDIEADSV